MKLEFSWQFFEKYSNAKFNEISSTGSWVLCWPKDGQTDRHQEASSRISQFCERAYQPLMPKSILQHTELSSNTDTNVHFQNSHLVHRFICRYEIPTAVTVRAAVLLDLNTTCWLCGLYTAGIT
jgi:hypothetical protein